MKPSIKVITLGVDNLERTVAFYRDGLGLSTEGIVGTEFADGAVAFFRLDGGLMLAVWPKRSLAHEANVPMGAPSAVEFSLAHNVESREEVDQVMAQAERAGATITMPAHDSPFFPGYSGYFQDPDGHVWEVAWNPEFESGE
jgi:predicted lactoylglutathione lyase